MPILPIGAAMMDTERMIPSQMNGGSPGSQQSGGQLSNGLFNGHHHYQNASPTTPIGHPHPGTDLNFILSSFTSLQNILIT